MRRSKKKMDRKQFEISPERAALLKQLCLHGLIGCLFFGSLGAGYHYVKKYVDDQVAMPTEAPAIVIKNKPRWMSEYLVQKIAASARPTGLHSAFDHDMLVKSREQLAKNPWISKVYDVRRAYREKPGDTLEIDCEYRVPAALVKWGAYYWLVDRDGFKLPEQYEEADVPKIVRVEDGHIDIRIIEGVHRPPPETGKHWVGDDLAGGLEVVALLRDKPYALEILKADVTDYFERRTAHVWLVTKDDSRIAWGRGPSELDKDPFMEISTAKKLDHLQRIYAQFGRVDTGKAKVDLRWDQPQSGTEPARSFRAVAGGS